MQVRKGIFNSLYILVNHFVTFFAVGLSDGGFNFFYSFFTGKHTGNGEKAGLHDGVDALAHTTCVCNLVGINGIELCLFADQMLLNNFREFFPEFFRCIMRIQQQRAPFSEIFDQVKQLKENPVVAANKLCLSNQIS